MNADHIKIVIAGAGSIGCYIGGMLVSGGANVRFLARQSMKNKIDAHGLHLTDWTGRSTQLSPDQLHMSTDPSILKDADLILICVKSKDTQAMANTILNSGNQHATVFSFQNGVSNTNTIHQILPNHTVLPVMVPYNVVSQANGHFHCGTQGHLYCQQHHKALLLKDAADTAKLGFELKHHMQSILWGKLLLNLNNPVNALSGIPLKQQIENRAYRKIYVACLKEGLAVLKAANIKPGQVAAVPIQTAVKILSLPNFLFKLLAKKMLAIDPKARSSMWEDLQNQRPVEVDYISGEIVKLGKRVNIETPMNQRLIRLVKQAEQSGNGSPNLSPQQILNG
ncbi:2-dehydropantoate 2-reductase [Oceaniserpentilla sp. 4NH20-0058]|uniref:2-dehydropantoate 2-reductase n=1 Tax=Oceaniserpentilla sp. 4NH20-0058 TaxID=3127660 RepID=UPI003108E599